MKILNGLLKVVVGAGGVMWGVIGHGATTINWNPASTPNAMAWNTGTYWDGGVFPNGAGVIADFSQFDGWADVGNATAIHLNSVNVTLGQFIFMVGNGTIGQSKNVVFRSASGTTSASVGRLIFDNNGSEALWRIQGRTTGDLAIGSGSASDYRRPTTGVGLKDSLEINNLNGARAINMHLDLKADTVGLKTVRITGDGTGAVVFMAEATSNRVVQNTNWSSILDGAGQIKIVQESATSELRLYGCNTYSGGTEIKNGGAVRIYGDQGLGDSSGNLTFSNGGGTLFVIGNNSSADNERFSLRQMRKTNWTEAAVMSRNIILNADAVIDYAASGNTTNYLASNISGTGALTIKDNSVMSANRVRLTGVNTYQGGTTFQNAGIEIAGDSNLGAAGAGVTIDGSTVILGLNTSGTGETISRNLTVIGSAQLAARDNMQAGSGWVWDGVISGTGCLTKSFGGTLILNHANTYEGGTRIGAGTGEGGKLYVTNTAGSGTGTGEVSLSDNATSLLGGSGRIAPTAGNNITFTGAGRMDPQGTLTLALSGASKLVLTDQVVFDVTIGTVSDQVVFETAGDWITGTSTINLNVAQGVGFENGISNYELFQGLETQGLTWNVTGLEGTGYTLNWNGTAWVLNVPAVPEASTYGVLLGLAVLAGVMVRRRKS